MIYSNLDRKVFHLNNAYDEAQTDAEKRDLLIEIEETNEQIEEQKIMLMDLIEFGQVDTYNHYDFEYIINELRNYPFCYRWQTHKDIKEHHTIYILNKSL